MISSGYHSGWKDKEMEGQKVPPKTGMLPGHLRNSSLHLTIFGVRILVVCVNGFHNTGRVIPFSVFNDFSQIEILNGKMVVAVREQTAY